MLSHLFLLKKGTMADEDDDSVSVDKDRVTFVNIPLFFN